jgi:hypothetical protein
VSVSGLPLNHLPAPSSLKWGEAPLPQRLRLPWLAKYNDIAAIDLLPAGGGPEDGTGQATRPRLVPAGG